MHLQEAILRKTAGPTMDPYAVKAQQLRQQNIARMQASPQHKAALANLQRGVQAYTAEEAKRRQLNLTDEQLNKQYQLKHRAMNAGAKAYVAAKRQNMSDEQAKAAQTAAATEAVESHVRGAGNIDALLRGGSRADQLKRFGQYMQQTPGAPSQIDPKVQQQLMEMDPQYRQAQAVKGAGGSVDKAVAAVTGGNTIGNAWTKYRYGTDISNMGKTVAGNMVNPGIQQGLAANKQQADDQYAAAAQQAPEVYRQKRNQELGAAWNKHKSWLLPVGAGLGGLALGSMLMRRPSTAGAQVAKTQPYQQPGVADWAQSYHQRGHRSAGTPQQTRIPSSNPFAAGIRNFMGGRRG